MEIVEANSTINQTNTDDSIWVLAWYFLPTVMTVPPLAVPANALVIRLLLGKPGICSTSEIFILNLACLDMLFCFFVVFEYIYFLCHLTVQASNFLSWGLNQAGGPMLLCVLGLDSYVAVCHPLVFPRLKDPKLRLSVCSGVTATTFVCCFLVKISAFYKWSSILGLLSAAILIISTCNILILHSLRQSGPNRKELHPVKKRAFKTVLTALVLVNIHYIPPIIEYLMRKVGPGCFRPYSVLTSVTYIFLSMSSFVQPLCYLIRTKQLPNMRCVCCSPDETKTVPAV